MNAITNNVQLAIKRLARQYRDKPGIEGLLTMMVQGFQDLEDAAQAMPAAMDTIDGAAGVQLDGLGKLLGQAREGRTDVVYRLWLKARLQRSRRSGTVEDLIVILSLLVPGSLISVSPSYPAGFSAEVQGVAVPNPDAVEIAKIFRLSRGGGIDGLFQWSPATPAETFTLPLIVATLDDVLVGGETSFAVSMMSGALPASGTGHPIKIGNGPDSDVKTAYATYAAGTLTLAGGDAIENPHNAGETLMLTGAEATDPGKGLGDSGDSSAGGQLAGIAR